MGFKLFLLACITLFHLSASAQEIYPDPVALLDKSNIKTMWITSSRHSTHDNRGRTSKVEYDKDGTERMYNLDGRKKKLRHTITTVVEGDTLRRFFRWGGEDVSIELPIVTQNDRIISYTTLDTHPYHTSSVDSIVYDDVNRVVAYRYIPGDKDGPGSPRHITIDYQADITVWQTEVSPKLAYFNYIERARNGKEILQYRSLASRKEKLLLSRYVLDDYGNWVEKYLYNKDGSETLESSRKIVYRKSAN